MSIRRSTARISGPRRSSHLFSEDSPSVKSIRSTTDASNGRSSVCSGTDKLNRSHRTIDRSLPSPLDHIDPRRWKNFPRLSTTSDFAGFPFSDINVNEEEETHLSADDHSIMGATPRAQDRASEGPSASTTTSDSRIRNAATEIRRAVSDGSYKIKRMAIRLTRAPSTLLHRSRSHMFGSNPPELSRPQNVMHSGVDSISQPDSAGQLQPSDINFQPHAHSPKHYGCDDKNRLSGALLKATPVNTPRCRRLPKHRFEDYSLIDLEMEDQPTPKLNRIDVIHEDSISPELGSKGMTESQRNSLIDRLALYPQESLLWLDKNSVVDRSSHHSMEQKTKAVSTTSVGSELDKSTVLSVNCDSMDDRIDRRKGSISGKDGQILWDKGNCSISTTSQTQGAVSVRKEFTIFPKSDHADQVDTSNTRFGKDAISSGSLLDDKTNSACSILDDGWTPTKARPGLRRTVSRLLRGDSRSARSENVKP